MTETWLKIPSFPGYIVSSEGRVRHSRVNAPILAGSLDKDGYRRVCLHGVTLRVHSIVCECFHGLRPKGMECAHLDGDKTNNAARNLAWKTPKENEADKLTHGTWQSGEKHPRARLTEAEVAAIRTDPRPSRAIASDYGVGQPHIVRIKNGAAWAESIAQTHPKAGQHD
jgi:hypothetical protein